VFAADGELFSFGPSVDQAVLDLVRDDSDPRFGDPGQVDRIEVGQGEVTDAALVLQVGHVAECVEVAGVVVVPPVELQDVQALDIHPPK